MKRNKSITEMKLTLKIIDHPSDKQFPTGAILRLEDGKNVYQYALSLDAEYKNGDVKLEARHLKRLFRGLAELL